MTDRLSRVSGYATLAFIEAGFIMALCWMLAKQQSPLVIDGCTVTHTKTEARP